jgi:ribosomal protein S18 acetylase RimI-like enzyme
LVVETTLTLKNDSLLDILRTQHLKEEASAAQWLGRGGTRNPILTRPSQYFQQQGFMFETTTNPDPQHHLSNQDEEAQQINVNCELINSPKAHQKSDIERPLPHRQFPGESPEGERHSTVAIIVGVMIFEVSSSKGYLVQPSWWHEFLFGDHSAYYINTLGVLAEFRKNGIASKML